MKKIINLLIFTVLFAGLFTACDVGLGTKLDITGPDVEILSPAARKAVGMQFEVKGTVIDTSSAIKELEISVSPPAITENDILYLPSDEIQATKDIEKRRWIYRNGAWFVSNDSGLTWAPYNNSGNIWDLDVNGNVNSVDWVLSVDLSMNINGSIVHPKDGEYLFKVQAKDVLDNSGDNSLRTRVLIFDRNPPKVDISNPFIYRGSNAYEQEPLEELHLIQDDGNERFDASFIGKFLTQGFKMQWQIEDNSDVWSIEIRLYKHDVSVDGYPETPLPDNYIYRYSHNFPEPPPDIPNLDLIAKPNGHVVVPALDSAPGFYDELGNLTLDATAPQLLNPITEKTTIKVVTVCYDSAKNVNQEKVLGYFIYWPLADEPWIEYTDGMDTLEYYENLFNSVPGNDFKAFLDERSFMIYPGRTLRSSAFHAHGLKNVVYSLYQFDETTRFVSEEPYSNDYSNVLIQNIQRSSGGYSTIFPWEIKPPSRSGYFILKAVAMGHNDSIENNIDGEIVLGRQSIEYTALFRVQDISFPDFEQPINPIPSQPLYVEVGKSANNDSITISGFARDATQVVNLDLVWINPQSTGFAAMSQLSYFRDPDYDGWQMASGLTPNGNPAEEGLFDNTHTNRVYRLALTPAGIDNETQRMRFSFSRTIPLSEFNISVTNQPLISQMFLLRAENPDKRTTIITYAPQGDTSPPVINIENVVINNDAMYKPRGFAVIPQFNAGDTIQINGTWREDSSEHLPIAAFFTPNFNVEINGHVFPKSAINISMNTIEVMDEVNINWRAEITVGDGNNQIPKSILSDTLVVNSTTRDIGGNRAESGVSWLIQSDHLRLMRISSEDQDGLYNTGKPVIIFLEFSKPVQLSNPSSAPTLRLNSRGTTQGTFATAVYAPELNASQSTRQYFRYTVAASDGTINLSPLAYLDIIGLETSIAWTANNYPFTWHRGTGDSREEIRVTTVQAHNNNVPDNAPSVPSGQIYARRLPTTTINSNGQEGADYMFTLIGGKRIQIDTQAPTVANIVSKTPVGNYSTGAEISIEVEFNKPVRIGATLPRLRLQVTNTGNVSPDDSSVNATTVQTSGNASDVRVSGRTITFVYRVKAGDTTNGNVITVTGHTGIVEDLAGTQLLATGISNMALASRNLTGRYIDTIAPGVPTVRILPGTGTATDANAITNIVNGVTHNGRSNAANRTLANVYQSALRLAIQGDTTAGAHKLDRIEYSITNSQTNFITFANIANTPITLQPGSYNIIARQIDRAGNISPWSNAVSFTFMTPGDFVTRIDSTSANGSYTNNASRQDNVNVTVYFRENITTSGTGNGVPTITLNVTPERTVQASNLTTAANSISFTYSVNTNENTPSGVNLDVTGIAITAADTTGVNVTSLITVPGGTTDLTNANRLRNRKAISIITGNLVLDSSNTAPVWATTQTSAQIRDADAWTGTISLKFNRAISKGTGSVIITQSTTGYRLPAVLTDAQSSKYRSARNFNSFYTRGTNGSLNGSADTSTKWILNYGQATVVAPNTSGTEIQQLAFDFHDAETVTIPVTSEDVEINGDTLTVNIRGSNALAVLGAQYNVTFSSGFVRDSLGYSWTPATSPFTNGGTTEINRPFIRIDKRVNEDRITSQTGSLSSPHINGNYSRVITSTARFDCRTPASIVRYLAEGTEYSASGVSGMGGWTMSGTATASNWINDNLDITGMPAQPNLSATTGGTVYDNFTGTGTATHLTIGTTNEQGFIWRVSARSRNSSIGSINSDQYEEMAYRTVLTYEMAGLTPGTSALGQPFSVGDQLWVRGGDAVASSSVPGFPLSWEDDFDRLRIDARRAGARLMQVSGNNVSVTTTARAATTNEFTSNAHGLGATGSIMQVTESGNVFHLRVTGTNTFRLYNTANAAATGTTAGNGVAASGTNITIQISMDGRSVWRFITWEINVRTWFDVVLGRFTSAAQAQPVNDAWQYGPRQVAYQRGGWSAQKDTYTMHPGKHRWIRITSGDYSNGLVNFSLLMNPRMAQSSVTLTQPNP